MKEKQPVFQPLSMIPTILQAIQSMLAASEKQLTYMEAVKEKPQILDDETVNRSLELYREQNINSIHILKQCKIWQQEKLNEFQLIQVQEIEKSTHLLTEINNELLAIFTYCQDHTINKIMDKDEVELALDFLTKKS